MRVLVHRRNAVLLSLMGVLLASVVPAVGQTQPPSARAVGTVKSVSGNSLVLVTDSGNETTVTFADSARIVRATPGQTDLKTATPIQISDIEVGDRVAIRGQATQGNALTASFALIMKKSDIAEKQQQEREAWRRGVGGIVKEVNPGGGTITINNAIVASGKSILIHLSPQTEIRRYAANSVKFEDSTPGTLDQIRAGDQLRARGSKSSDGTEFTAQAIVSGSFRDIAGTVVSTDAANNTVTINDLSTKKPVAVKIGPDSMLRKLPPFVAMGIAMRLKGGAAGVAGGGMPGNGGAAMGGGAAAGPNGGAGGRGANAATGDGDRGNWQRAGGQGGPGMSGGPGGFRGNGPPDFQQMLSRMPVVSISDLNKGDAVMLVATEGGSGSGPTAITLLTGVDPILSAAPPGLNAAATVLSPWNLGQAAGAEAAASGP